MNRLPTVLYFTFVSGLALALMDFGMLGLGIAIGVYALGFAVFAIVRDSLSAAGWPLLLLASGLLFVLMMIRRWRRIRREAARPPRANTIEDTWPDATFAAALRGMPPKRNPAPLRTFTGGWRSDVDGIADPVERARRVLERDRYAGRVVDVSADAAKRFAALRSITDDHVAALAHSLGIDLKDTEVDVYVLPDGRRVTLAEYLDERTPAKGIAGKTFDEHGMRTEPDDLFRARVIAEMRNPPGRPLICEHGLGFPCAHCDEAIGAEVA